MPNLEVTLFGISLSLFSACIFNLAAVLQKREADSLPELKFDNIKETIETLIQFLKNKVWVLAIILGVLGAPFYMISFGLIGVTLVQPLQGFGVLVLAIFSVKVLNESLNAYEKSGIIFLLVAPLFLGLGGIQGQITFTVSFDYFAPIILGMCGIQEKVLNINTPGLLTALLIFTIVVLIISVSLYLAHFKAESRQGIIFSILAGIDFAIGAIFTQILVPIFGIILTGGGQSFSAYILIFLIAGFVAVVGYVLGIIFVQCAFQRGKAITVVPFQSSCATMLPILAGILIYGQIVSEPIFFIIGVILMILGVSSLSRIQE